MYYSIKLENVSWPSGSINIFMIRETNMYFNEKMFAFSTNNILTRSVYIRE